MKPARAKSVRAVAAAAVAAIAVVAVAVALAAVAIAAVAVAVDVAKAAVVGTGNGTKKYTFVSLRGGFGAVNASRPLLFLEGESSRNKAHALNP